MPRRSFDGYTTLGDDGWLSSSDGFKNTRKWAIRVCVVLVVLFLVLWLTVFLVDHQHGRASARLLPQDDGVLAVGSSAELQGSVHPAYSVSPQPYHCSWCFRSVVNTSSSSTATSGAVYGAPACQDAPHPFTVHTAITQDDARASSPRQARFQCRLLGLFPLHQSDWVSLSPVAQFAQTPMVTNDNELLALTWYPQQPGQRARGSLLVGVTPPITQPRRGQMITSRNGSVAVVFEHVLRNASTTNPTELYAVAAPALSDLYVDALFQNFTMTPQSEAGVVKRALEGNGTLTVRNASVEGRKLAGYSASAPAWVLANKAAKPLVRPIMRLSPLPKRSVEASDSKIMYKDASTEGILPQFSFDLPRGVGVTLPTLTGKLDGHLRLETLQLTGSVHTSMDMAGGRARTFAAYVQVGVVGVVSFSLLARAGLSFEIEYIPGSDYSGVFKAHTLSKYFLSTFKIQFPLGFKVEFQSQMSIDGQLRFAQEWVFGVQCVDPVARGPSGCSLTHKVLKRQRSFTTSPPLDQLGAAFTICKAALDLSLGMPRFSWQPIPKVSPAVNLDIARHVWFDARTPGSSVVNGIAVTTCPCSANRLCSTQGTITTAMRIDFSISMRIFKLGFPLFKYPITSFDGSVWGETCSSAQSRTCQPAFIPIGQFHGTVTQVAVIRSSYPMTVVFTANSAPTVSYSAVHQGRHWSCGGHMEIVSAEAGKLEMVEHITWSRGVTCFNRGQVHLDLTTGVTWEMKWWYSYETPSKDTPLTSGPLTFACANPCPTGQSCRSTMVDDKLGTCV